MPKLEKHFFVQTDVKYGRQTFFRPKKYHFTGLGIQITISQ